VRYLYIRSSFCYSEQVAYTTRTITVPSTLSSVADINFNVSLTHSYLSDVEMEVISPRNNSVNYLIGVVVIQIVPYCLAMMTQD
jgi:subtilisin-like proprotein convertase family protein